MAACKQCTYDPEFFLIEREKTEAVENGEIPDYLEFFEKWKEGLILWVRE